MLKKSSNYLFVSPSFILLIIILLLILLIGGRSVQATPQENYLKVIAPAHVLESDSRNIILWHDYEAFGLYKIKSETFANLPHETRSQLTLSEDMDELLIGGLGLISKQSGLNQPDTLNIYDGKNLHLIQFAGPIKDEWLDQVEKTGTELVHYIANNGYLVWTDDTGRQALQALTQDGEFLQKSFPYFSPLKLGTSLRERQNNHQSDEALVTVNVQMFRHKDKYTSESIISDLAEGQSPTWEPVLKYQNTMVVVARKDIPKISQLPDVVWIGEKFERELTDEVQGRILAGSLNPSQTEPGGPGYLGWFDLMKLSKNPADYPIVDIVDDGIGNGIAADAAGDITFRELGNADLPSRITYIANCTSEMSGAGPDGHGHLNVSIAGGYDARQGFPYQDEEGYQRGLGINPYGRFAGTRVFDGNFNLSGCGGTDLSLLRETYNRGARIMSNSWSCRGCAGTYDDSSQAFDAGVRDADSMMPGNQEFTILFSAGNAGPDLDTIGTPGNGKNMITVGASENVRPTWLDGCGIGQDGADNVQDIAKFSSRGPAPGERIKPDVVAPGTHIQGTASTDANYIGAEVCDSYQPTNQRIFAASSGTSLSTPAVAGIASLAHSYIRLEKEVENPSPALIKGFIIAHTAFLSGEDAGENRPNFHQGFGLPNMTDAFDATSRVLYDQEHIFSDSGQTWTNKLTVADPSKPVRIVMTYTDYPGAIGSDPQVNDLDLSVKANGKLYHGNNMDGVWSMPGGSADKVNNVEAVFLPDVSDSAIEITVTAFNIAGDGVPGSGDETDQDFAIVCSNCIIQSDFTVALDPQSNDICLPGSANYTVSLDAIHNFSSQVTLSAETVPNGVSAQFENNPITPPTQTQLILTAGPTTLPGSYSVTVTGNNSERHHSTSLNLNIYSITPNSPDLLSPQDGVVEQPPDLTLTWQAVEEAASYDLQIATDSRFENIVVQETGITEPGFTPGNLETGQLYYWRVRAINGCGTGNYSSTYFFATELLPGSCPLGAEVDILYSTNFEDQVNDWSSSGINDTWSLSSIRSHSADTSYYAQNLGEVSDQMLVSPPVTLPPFEGPQTLQFWNYQEMESNAQIDDQCFDGSILEISTDEGNTWKQVGGPPGDDGVLITDPYDGYIDGLHENPLGGKAGWCGDPQDWLNSVVKLDDYAGETVQFRFRLGSDDNISHEGWYIDDVLIQACKIRATDLYLPIIGKQ